MKMHIMVKGGIIALLFFFSAAYAATIRYVHPDSVLSTIQAGLDACNPGDIVLVSPGTWYENIVWPARQGIKLISAGGPIYTTLDGDTAGSVITITTGVDSTTVISGFTIRNGYAQHGGGIYCENSAPSITQNIIRNNRAISGGSGAGIYLYNSPAVITNNTLNYNFADSAAGGIFCDDNSSGTIKDNTLYENRSEFGGGIFCQECSPTISENTLFSNRADSAGAGIGASINASPVISDNIIYNNRQNAGNEWCGGGGIGTGAGCLPYINNNFIIENFAGFGGGGIACHDATITSNTISENYSAYGGGLVFAANSSPTVTGNTITNNSVVSIGGGILLDQNCSASITGNLVDSNTADYGGAIAISSNGTPTISKNYIRWNSASNTGAGIWINGSGLTTIDSCVIIGNYGDGVNGGSSTNADIHYCDILDNTAYGVRKSGSGGSFDAEYNFWGDASGPGGSGPGSGDEVSSNVDYDPWLAVSVRDSVIPASPYVDSRKSGTDIVLTWHPVTTDTLGNPETVNSYIIYRSSSPSFIPDPLNSIGTVLYPDTEYTDIGALTVTQSYYYLVKSVDWTFNKSKKSNMGYMFRKSLNENAGDESDRNWVSLPFGSEYDSIKDLTDDLSPSGDPISKITRLDVETQAYFSWIYHPILNWYGNHPTMPNFPIVMGQAYEMVAAADDTVIFVGSNDPAGEVSLNENPGDVSDRNWVSIPYNAAYDSVSDITDELSPSGVPVSKITFLDEGIQAYFSWIYHPILNWYGNHPTTPNFPIEPGDGYEFVATKDTTWNPTEHSNGSVLARKSRRSVRRSDVHMHIGESLEPQREPVWVKKEAYSQALTRAPEYQRNIAIAKETKRTAFEEAEVYEPASQIDNLALSSERIDYREPGISHIVYADLELEGFDNLVFTAYRPHKPYDVLTENSVGCVIMECGTFYLISFDVGNFKQPWQEREEVILIIEATKQGRGYCAIVNFELNKGVDIQKLMEISLIEIPHPTVRNGELYWDAINNENIMGYSLYQNDKRLNERLLTRNDFNAKDNVQLKPVIRGGYETVHLSQNPQGTKNTELPISYAFNIYPNPFTKRARIDYALPHTTEVDVAVYDIAGRRVKSLVSDRREPGYYQTHWFGDDELGRRVASGVYFIKMNAQEFESEHKVIFVQ